MSNIYDNHSFLSKIYKHPTLPIIATDEFNFFRCVEFNPTFYNKTVSELFHGNLRNSNKSNRYSELFPDQKLSYWSSSRDTARKEIKQHGSSKNILTFWAYDDATSSFPTLSTKREPLIIIDGIQFGFENILYKSDMNLELSKSDMELIKQINEQKPDCVAYNSMITGHTNYIFFEKGFNKLSVRQVSLRLGELESKNTNQIVCADTSDYTPILKNYGCYFSPIAKTGTNEKYCDSLEYKFRKEINSYYYDQYRNSMI